MPPAQNAPTSAWQAWSARQDAWIRSIPYAQAFANEGFTLLNLGFGQTHWEPGLGLPLGITETAVWWVVRPITPTAPTQTKKVETNLAASTPPPTCETITGPGSACIATDGGFPATISATYQYLGSGSTKGHVELGAGGCPGSLVINSPDVYLTYGRIQVDNATSSASFSSGML